MFPRDRYAPPSGHRKPERPSPFLVIPRMGMSRGAAIVVGVHAFIILLLLWHSADLLAGAGDGLGPRGGGGGGGRQALHTFLLAGRGVPQAVPIPPVPQVAMTKMPLPDPVKLDLPKVQPAPPVVAQVAAAPGTGNGTTGGPGEGAGSGGGKGEGAGTGAGNDSGPGTGGDGNYVPLPYLLTWPLPPTCLPHGRYTIHFWVTESGSISKVAIEPQVRDGGCEHEFEKRAYDYRFLPAKTKSGIPVASTISAQVQK